MKYFTAAGMLILGSLFISNSYAQTPTSAQCNATIATLQVDTSAVLCRQAGNQVAIAKSAYIGNNMTMFQNTISSTCSPTSPFQACSQSYIANVTSLLTSSCGNNLALIPDTTMSSFAVSLAYSNVYVQTLCSQDSTTGYCASDFFSSFVEWPITYDIVIGTSLGVFAPAAGNLTSAILSQPTSVTCSTCSMKVYTIVLAFVENILRGTGIISTTSVGYSAPGTSITTQEQQILDNIAHMNATLTVLCQHSYLDFPVAGVTPIPLPTNHSTTVSHTKTANATATHANKTTSAAATITGIMAGSNSSSNATETVTVHSGATTSHSSISITVFAGIIALLAMVSL